MTEWNFCVQSPAQLTNNTYRIIVYSRILSNIQYDDVGNALLLFVVHQKHKTDLYFGKTTSRHQIMKQKAELYQV